jgi:hypothetical protein
MAATFTKTQLAVFASATEGTLEVLPLVNGTMDFTATPVVTSGIVVKGHRNAMFALRNAGLVRRDTRGADNMGLLTEAGVAALRAL